MRQPPGSGPGGAFMPPLVGSTLLFAAGFADAAAVHALHGFFPSFMSGNTTLLGIAVAGGDTMLAGIAVVVIAAYTAGAAAGAILGDAAGRWQSRTVASAEIVLLGAATVLWHRSHDWHALLPVTFAMGLQTVLHQPLGGVDIGRGFVTGTLVSAAQALARAVRDRRLPPAGLVQACCWAMFACGAVAGSWCQRRFGLEAALLAVCALLLPSAASRDGEAGRRG